MELGGITETSYTPEYKGNRALPEKERLSLKIVPMRAMDVLHDGTPEDIYSWRDNLQVSHAAQRAMDGATPSQLRLLRVVVSHTTELRNFRFDGEETTDPAEVWPRLSHGHSGLLLEVFGQVERASSLSEDEAGNSPSPSDGGATTDASATDAAEGASLDDASTKPAATE